ncbi:hypothetical protein [Micromonospora sp. NPDC023814]|uniref:hypothetical protein n=1 Tax=Micromonospora sp. NPDC023814 TaxID=3154596 RepID=UPI003408F1A3
MAVDYNKATNGSVSNVIHVDPLMLWDKCRKILDYLELVVKELTEIGNKWENVQIRWQGPDATTAQDFVNQLQAAFTALFGPAGATDISDLKSGEGSLIKLSAGISMASRNYGGAEESVCEVMVSFAQALGEESGGGRNSWEGVQTYGPLSEYRGFGQKWVP